MTIKQELLNLGMKLTEFDHYCSDLYIKKNSISEAWLKTYEFKQNVKKFYSHIDNSIWYDIPFAYIEYYNK